MAALQERETTTGAPIVEFAPLGDDQIAAQTDAGSFSRGKTYFRGKRIFNAVRRGDLLRARCRGSSGGPYLVEASLAPTGDPGARNPVRYHCTCPRGGFCKHVVALLLTWQERPEAFDILVAAMVSAHPELEPLIALPPPATMTPNAAPVDETAIRRIVAGALHDPDEYEERGGYGQYDRYEFSYGYDEYDDASQVAAELRKVVEYGDAYVDGGFWRNALVVSAVLAEQLAPEIGEYYDEEGELSRLLHRADANLAACLEAQAQAAADERFTTDERMRLIDAIFAIWEADIAAGGIGLSEAGPEAVGALATPAELEHVRERLRGMILPTAGDPAPRQWHNRAVIGFLSLLKGDAGLTDEELLAAYRDAELWQDAATLLLEMGRPEEAISLAARKLDTVHMLIAFADRLAAANDPERIGQAIRLVDDRLWEHEGQNIHHDQMLREWLERRHLEHGSPEKALALAQDRFQVSPTKPTYDAVRTAALHPGQSGVDWPKLRSTLLAALAKSNAHYALIDIHLEASEVAEAIDVLRRLEKSGGADATGWDGVYGSSAGSYSARVAAAAETRFPDDAVQIYRRLADRLIAERGRANYQTAAGYLARVKRVLAEHGKAEEWSSLIADLRAANKSLRALKEELDLLGLA
jgi:hypothetical protein